MGRRKRKQVVYRPVKTLPKIFTCVICGKKTMKTKIDKTAQTAKIICGSCGKEQEVSANEITEPVDAFGDFIDIYFAAQEYERLVKRSKRLESKKQFSELAMVYSFLSDICNNNSKEALEEHEKTQSAEDLENAQKWKGQADVYMKMSKDIYMKLELKELEDGIEESIYEDEEADQFGDGKTSQGKVKRGRELSDIIDDPGFLEF